MKLKKKAAKSLCLEFVSAKMRLIFIYLDYDWSRGSQRDKSRCEK